MMFRSGFLIVAALVAFGCVAQQKRPYTVETTFEKLKRDYPFIKPIQPLQDASIASAEDVTYRTLDDIDLKLDVYYPSDAKDASYPAVLLVHGGGWLSGSKENQRTMAQHLAANGYVGITAAYRLSDVATYPAAVVDLKAAVRWIKRHANEYSIDSDKIAILGTSAGAQLATLVGVTGDQERFRESEDDNETSDAVQAIINVDGIVSFIHPESEEGTYAAKWLGGTKTENPEIWKEASPLQHVDERTPPTLFINSTQPRFHAGRDDMVKLLDQQDIYSEVHTIPGSPHSFWLMQPWFEKTLQFTTSFLDRVFKANTTEVYREIIVAQDGSGDFTRVQEAIEDTRDFGPGYVKIFIRNGTYEEKITVPVWKRKIALVGESRSGVILVNADHSGKDIPETGGVHSTFSSFTLKVEGSNFYAENLTIKNASCDEGQAVALHVSGDLAIFRNCDILGCQDTLYTEGESSHNYFDNCYIEGTTDFIFGQATVFFEGCTIKSKSNSYITAASTTAGQKFGYVFKDCKLVAAAGIDKVFLGRPWRPYARTVFIDCQLGPHIVPEGWHKWGGDSMFPAKERTAFYAEYNSSGPGANPSGRVWWSHQLTTEEAGTYTKAKVLGGKTEWFHLNFDN